MVIAGDFKVELVDENTKEPFPEHSMNGQTYVAIQKQYSGWYNSNGYIDLD